MLRAVAKATVQAAFGRLPQGSRQYRVLTRKHLGTGRSHVSKLQRVWPHYERVWEDLGGLPLEGKRVWIHECGVTAFSPLAAFAATGTGGLVTNTSERILTRYLARSVNGVLAAWEAQKPLHPSRRRALEALRWHQDATEAIESLQGEVHVGVSPDRIPLGSDSVDLGHSGGALEHYRQDDLDHFLRESFRVLKPGGLVSHVFDHRDHLFHADKGIPFLAHLRFTDRTYESLFGHDLGYHNRLSPTQVAARFEAAGFQRVAVRRLVLPAQEFVQDDDVPTRGRPGLERESLSAKFSGMSDLDLYTAAGHYLYRKPRRKQAVVSFR